MMMLPRITTWTLISGAMIVTGLSWRYAGAACGHPSTPGSLAGDWRGGAGVRVQRPLAPDSLKG